MPDVTIQPDSLAFIQHSAGTTGLQKGVALTHAAVLTQLEHLVERLKIDGATDRVYSWLPLYHDMGLIACFMLPSGQPYACRDAVAAGLGDASETMLQIIEDYKCTLAWLPNFAFQFVPRRTRQRALPQFDLSSVRALINCSEPVRSSSMKEFHEAFARWAETCCAAVLLRDGGKCLCGDPVGHHAGLRPDTHLGGRPTISQQPAHRAC